MDLCQFKIEVYQPHAKDIKAIFNKHKKAGIVYQGMQRDGSYRIIQGTYKYSMDTYQAFMVEIKAYKSTKALYN